MRPTAVSRRRRGVRVFLAAEWLEGRTLLSVPGENALVPSASPATSSELGTFNLQLRSGSLQALAQLMPVITADGATVTTTTISGLYVVETPDQSMGQLEADLSSNPAVAYAEPVQTFQIQTAPNDPDYQNGDQWQLNGAWGVNAQAAWNVTTGSDEVIVADVDTGLNYNLKDIYDNVWLNQPEIPANVVGNLTDVYNDGVITFTDLNNPANQGAGKIEDTNGDGIITGADVLASTSVGGWVNSGVPDTQDGDTSDPNDFIGWNFVNDTNNPMDAEGHGTFHRGRDRRDDQQLARAAPAWSGTRRSCRWRSSTLPETGPTPLRPRRSNTRSITAPRSSTRAGVAPAPIPRSKPRLPTRMLTA